MLYRLKDPAGRPWDLNMDRISGFSRMVGGKLADNERKLIFRLKRRHSSVGPGRPVRLFPREFDGALLGGLSQFTNTDEAPLRSISARYEMGGDRLWMADIRINGRPVVGIVDLSPYSSCKQSRRAA